MPRTEPPYRADHVGSLLRSQRLLDARAEFADGDKVRLIVETAGEVWA